GAHRRAQQPGPRAGPDRGAERLLGHRSDGARLDRVVRDAPAGYVRIMSRPGVLFDVDGTLVDTTYLHTEAWWEALRQHEHHVPMAEIHRSIGMGSDKILDHLLGDDRDRSADEELVT